MILNLPTIFNKRLTSNPDGSQIVELGESVFQYKKQATVIDFIIITQDQAGKPWLIAQTLYTKESAMAALFFLNGYPNPYAIDEGDKLLVFDDETMNSVLVDLNGVTKEFYNIKPQDSSGIAQKKNKQNRIDQNRQAILSKLSGNNLALSQSAIAPNASIGVPAISAADGVITFGTDVSDARCKSSNLSETQTRTEMIRAAIKKKLGVIK